MKRILVVDQATINTSYNVIEIVDEEPKWICCSVIKIKSTKNTMDRVNELYSRLAEIIEEYNIDTLVLEEVPVSRRTNLNTTVVLLKLLGILELLGVRMGINVEIMNVAFWKNLAGIRSKNRTDQKADSIKLALGRWKAYQEIIAHSDDVADALNMGYAFLKYKKII